MAVSPDSIDASIFCDQPLHRLCCQRHILDMSSNIKQLQGKTRHHKPRDNTCCTTSENRCNRVGWIPDSSAHLTGAPPRAGKNTRNRQLTITLVREANWHTPWSLSTEKLQSKPKPLAIFPKIAKTTNYLLPSQKAPSESTTPPPRSPPRARPRAMPPPAPHRRLQSLPVPAKVSLGKVLLRSCWPISPLWTFR